MTSTIEKYEVRSRFTNALQFTAEISVTPDMLPCVKLGLAVKWGLVNGADLSNANLSNANLSGARNREYAIGLPDEKKDEKEADEDDEPDPAAAAPVAGDDTTQDDA